MEVLQPQPVPQPVATRSVRGAEAWAAGLLAWLWGVSWRCAGSAATEGEGRLVIRFSLSCQH